MFRNQKDQCHFDRIDPVDPSSAPPGCCVADGPVLPDQASAALSTFISNYLTPCGLRSLSPHDPLHRERFNRDENYHTGCVWPWLTGMYVDPSFRKGRSHPSVAVLPAPILSPTRRKGPPHLRDL